MARRARSGPSLGNLALGPRADTGDDQSGFVGRQVTSNGIRSEPRDGIGYRWIQVEGPSVPLKIEEGFIYTFVQKEPGLYRFALTVASGGAISDPETVDVLVEPNRPAPTVAPIQPPLALREPAAASLAQFDGGRALARPLAEAFEAVAAPGRPL